MLYSSIGTPNFTIVFIFLIRIIYSSMNSGSASYQTCNVFYTSSRPFHGGDSFPLYQAICALIKSYLQGTRFCTKIIQTNSYISLLTLPPSDDVGYGWRVFTRTEFFLRKSVKLSYFDDMSHKNLYKGLEGQWWSLFMCHYHIATQKEH